jgi:hypothetical protein
MTIEVPLSRLPPSPPQLEGQHVLEGDFELVRHLYGVLGMIGGSEWQFGQALALLEWCRASTPAPSIDPANPPKFDPPKFPIIESQWATRRSWELMAAREGAMTIYHFGQALAAIAPAVRQCSSIADRVDYAALRLARKSFKAAFPNHYAIRHVVGHVVDFTATVEKRNRHSVMPPWQHTFDDAGTLQYAGTRPIFSPGNLHGRAYLVTYEGDVHFYELRAETLERLLAIRERIYSAFKAVTDLDFYTCGYCGSRNLNEVYGRRVYRCGDCNKMVVDELMIAMKYRRLRAAAATASPPVAATG